MKKSIYFYQGLLHFFVFFSGIARRHLNPASPALGVDGADPGPVGGLPHSAGQLFRLLPQTLIHWLLEHSHQENEESLKNM